MMILIDRDGTLIEECEYLKHPNQVKLLPGVVPALKRLAQAGYPLVIVTNQSGVGRGLMTRRDVERVHRRLEQMLRARGIRIQGIYWCPHAPDAQCSCRKPKIKLVRQAARDLKVSPKGSISIGDKWSDVRLGQHYRGAGVLVLTGHGKHSLKKSYHRHKADYVASTMQSAVQWILKKESLRWTSKHPKD
jgi:D-glycero-D-manno-heptose 1,7-bisphosphate phosphatase